MVYEHFYIHFSTNFFDYLTLYFTHQMHFYWVYILT